MADCGQPPLRTSKFPILVQIGVNSRACHCSEKLSNPLRNTYWGVGNPKEIEISAMR